MDDIRQVFADNLIFYRKSLGLTQEELSQKADLHRTYISQLERKIKSPSIDTLSKLAIILNIQAFQLLIKR